MKYLFCFIVALACTACGSNKTASVAADVDTCSVMFSADSAFAFLKAQCDYGYRLPGSAAHRQCGDYIAAKFRQYGLTVTEQTAQVKAWDGTMLPMRNIIAAFRPEAEQRVMICAHWDCRPWADADPDAANHRKPVMAANDGASGVAVMIELARLMAALDPKVGVDFVCFDIEDYGAPAWANYEGNDDWCLGSQYWSAHPHVEGYDARYAVLLDMVGGRGSRFCYEGFSMKYAPAVVAKIWGAAQVIGASDIFEQRDGGWVTDDHVPVNEIAMIPAVDIIPHYDSDPSFGPTWHTVNDTPEHIDPAVLRAVGQTLLQLLHTEE